MRAAVCVNATFVLYIMFGGAWTGSWRAGLMFFALTIRGSKDDGVGTGSCAMTLCARGEELQRML